MPDVPRTPSAPRFRPGRVHAGRRRPNPTVQVGGFDPKPKPPGNLNIQILNPRPASAGRAFPQLASGCRLSRRYPCQEDLELLLITPCCYAPTTSDYSLRVLFGHSRPGDSGFHSRVISYCLRFASSRFRLHLEIRGTVNSSVPTNPSPSPPSQCKGIPIRPLLKYPGSTQPVTSWVAGYLYVLISQN